MLALEHLLDRVDSLFIGGGMAVTFLRALGNPAGASSVEEDRLEFAVEMLGRARDKGVQVHLPRDVVVTPSFGADSGEARTVPVDEVPPAWYVMDIGAETVEEFVSGLETCKTVIWNGPMGVFEYPAFTEGTRRVGEALASLDATVVVGGGLHGGGRGGVGPFGQDDPRVHGGWGVAGVPGRKGAARDRRPPG